MRAGQSAALACLARASRRSGRIPRTVTRAAAVGGLGGDDAVAASRRAPGRGRARRPSPGRPSRPSGAVPSSERERRRRDVDGRASGGRGGGRPESRRGRRCPAVPPTTTSRPPSGEPAAQRGQLLGARGSTRRRPARRGGRGPTRPRAGSGRSATVSGTMTAALLVLDGRQAQGADDAAAVVLGDTPTTSCARVVDRRRRPSGGRSPGRRWTRTTSSCWPKDGGWA